MQRVRVERAMLDQELGETLVAELFTGRIPCLGDSVGVEEQPVAGHERQLRFLIAGVRKHAEHDASARQLLDPAVARTSSGGLWPALAYEATAPLPVDAGVTERDEPAAGHVRQSRRLTLAQIAWGRALSCANARTAACRFDISSAAGRPLPATSAIDEPDDIGPNVSAS